MSFAEIATMLFSTLDLPGRLGLSTTLHCLPFQCSTSVLRKPLVSTENPTAQMLLAEMAVMLLSVLKLARGLGLATTFHVVPFQCSINVSWLKLLSVYLPTATTSL